MVAPLPAPLKIGQNEYVVELVGGPRGHDCWLRARGASEPIAFLLAHFEDRETAAIQLRDGFSLEAGAFQLRILQALVRIGVARQLPLVRRPQPVQSAQPWNVATVHELEVA